jgi:hypothetical protein
MPSSTRRALTDKSCSPLRSLLLADGAAEGHQHQRGQEQPSPSAGTRRRTRASAPRADDPAIIACAISSARAGSGVMAPTCCGSGRPLGRRARRVAQRLGQRSMCSRLMSCSQVVDQRDADRAAQIAHQVEQARRVAQFGPSKPFSASPTLGTMHSMIAKLRTACGQSNAWKPHSGVMKRTARGPPRTGQAEGDDDALVDALRQAAAIGTPIS